MRNVEGNEFVPHISLTVSIAMAVIGVAFLIIFIHHIAVAIQADSVIADVFSELEERIKDLYPLASSKQSSRMQDDSDSDEESAQTLKASKSGYLEAIDFYGLVDTLEGSGKLLFKLHPGDFVAKDGVICILTGRETLSEDIEKSLRKCLAIAHSRTPTQDIGFVLNQLVEIAVRALSPSMNDPFTALSCLDRIGEALELIADRRLVPKAALEEKIAKAVSLPERSLQSYVEQTIGPIRRAGSAHITISLRIIGILQAVSRRARTKEQMQALLKAGELVLQEFTRAGAIPSDIEQVEDAFTRFQSALHQKAPQYPQS